MVALIVLLDILMTSYVISSTISQQNKTIYFIIFVVLHLLMLLFNVF